MFSPPQFYASPQPGYEYGASPPGYSSPPGYGASPPAYETAPGYDAYYQGAGGGDVDPSCLEIGTHKMSESASTWNNLHPNWKKSRRERNRMTPEEQAMQRMATNSPKKKGKK